MAITSPTIRVIVVDDHLLLRQMIEKFINNFEGVEVVAGLSNLAEALERIQILRPHIIVIDDYLISSPAVSTTAAIEEIRALGIPVRILVASMYREMDLARQVLDAGTDGFILKTEMYEHLASAILQLYQGKSYLSRETVRVDAAPP